MKENLLKNIPLTQSQLGIYLECINHPESLMYNVTFFFGFPKGTDWERLKNAVKKAMFSHPSASFSVKNENGEPGMVSGTFDFDIPEKTARSVSEEKKSFVQPFDLEKAPLYRFEILHTPEEEGLLFDGHHMIFDGTTIHLLAEAILKAYDTGSCDPESYSIFEASADETALSGTEQYQKAEAYFEEKFAGTEFDCKPASDVLTEGMGSSLSGDCILVKTDDFFTKEEILSFTKRTGISENAFFTGAFAYALGKYSGMKETAFCTAHHGRNEKNAGTFGMFVKTMPMHFDLEETEEVSGFLGKVYNDYYSTKKNCILPFGDLSLKYGISADVSFVFQASLYEDMPFSEGAMTMRYECPPDISQDLLFMVLGSGASYEVQAYHKLSVYSKAYMEHFCRFYFAVVKEMLCCETLSEIRLTDEDAFTELSALNHTESPYESGKTVVDLFRRQAEKTPDKTCVVYKEKRFTYAEVDRITDILAKHLRRAGIGPEKVAGVLIHRNEFMALCSLGVLKAGGAYLPLDPTYPPERLNLMVKDSGAVLLMEDRDLSGIITEDFTGLRIPTDEICELPDIEEELSAPKPGDLFVMLYTSGSTGLPKGVMFEHGNALVTTEWVKKYYDMDETSRVTAYASYGFDAHAYDMYPAITSGAELHVIPDDIRLDLPALRDYFNENGITHTVMTMQVGRQFALMGGFTSLRHLSVAGEKLTPLDQPEGFNFYNLYGPTEASIIISAFLLDQKYKDVPIGSAVENLKTYVVDPAGRLLPTGAVGELWIAGPHVTRGYLNRPEKTAEAYGENPFEAVPGYERVYRTGDIVRLLPDGNIQFVGRRDAQVKVRGFRVELTEVEEVIRRYPGVKDATVAAFDAASGGKFLAAYIVSEEEIAPDRLASFIKSEKPPYMVPAVTMKIDKIPLNQNGKVNKKALPLPEFKAEDMTAPETELQKKILDIVSEVIGHKNFGIDTDLFEAGLTSIGMIKLNVSLADALGIAVKLTDVKENDTVRKLENFAKESVQEESYAIREDYPLTETQRGVLMECLQEEGSTAYNVPLLLKIGKTIDLTRLQEAVGKAINAHPYLKTVLRADENGDIRAVRNDALPVSVSMIEGDPDFENVIRPFTLLGGALYRAEIYEGKEENCLFIDCHHIISDGVSETILLSDIDRAYAGEELTEEKYTGFDAALEEEVQRKTEAYEKAKAYYDALLSGCDSECLPPRAPEEGKAGARHLIRTGSTEFSAVEKFCKDNDVTPNAFFNTVFAYVLSRFDYKDDVVYTTIYNGRNDSRLARSTAMLVKTLPVIFDISGKASVRDTVKALGTELRDSMASDLYSFAEISRAYSVKADLLFAYQGSEFTFDTLCGEKAEILPIGSENAKAPISLCIYIKNGKILADAEYEQSLYSEKFMESFVDSFLKASEEFLGKETLGEVSLLTENAEHMYEALNDNDMPVREVPCFTLTDEFTTKDPEKTAVITTAKSLTYGELTALSNRTANALLKLGMQHGTIIGLLIDRCAEVYVCEYGIMKAGCAFLPILPSYPDDRIDFCLQNAESPLVITTEKILSERKELFAPDKPYRAVTVEEILRAEDDAAPAAEVRMEDLAYCIYTSGSTGTPKGVMINHHNLTNFVQTHIKTMKFLTDPAADGAMNTVSSISFDMSLYEMLPSICAGKTSSMPTDEEIHNPAAMIKFIQYAKVQMFICTPTYMANMISIPEFAKCIPGFVSLTLGAEVFPESLYETLKTLAPDMQILNGYGPTECTICCSIKDLTNDKKVTIGRPTGNFKFYVTDKCGNILPPFASGELIICGPGVGDGYIKLPEKNAQSFFTLRGRRAYHSGDLVRLSGDSEIAFTGRLDNQIKLRGFRIELDEIEKAVCAFDGVKQCKVLLRTNGSEEYLAAFYTADRTVSPEELTEHLKSCLTYYMVPSVLMQLPKMPLTPNGKIDKKGFPEAERAVKNKGHKAAKKSLEQKICETFASVLGLSEVYADDDFFDLGGSSISASKVTMMLMSEGIDAKYGDIFDHPTPEGLSEFIERKKAPVKATADDDSLLSINGQKTRKALLYNTVKYAPEVERKPLGDVLLTGATGFLGIHILKELLEIESGHITCLVRKGKFKNPEDRLKTLLIYYFSNGFTDAFKTRITVLDADITDSGLSETLKDVPFDTVFNCAACVKHFAEDDILERINVHGVENLIGICQKRDAKLIQISTVSVPGIHTPESYEKQIRMHENELFVIDDMSNKYCISKYNAELRMFDAIENGLRGKVIRVGNLMGRHSDGEFQINMETNMFMSGIRGFAVMGKYPISHMTDPMSFSPIDCTARAAVLLAGTNDQFTAFNCNSRYGFDEMKIIDACNRNGITIIPEKDEIYYEEFHKKLGEDSINEKLGGLAAYDIKDAHAVETDNLFTTNILYRIGFSWPLVDDAYLDRSINSIMTLDYFDLDEDSEE